MTAILDFVLYAALFIYVLLVVLVVWRVWRGENVVDRLIGVELTGTLILAVLVLVSLISRDSIYIDVALGLAALGFIGTIALARYIVDESVF
jgi:multisubunit Na+/H+ antiporter MnhF subunit